MGSLSLLGAKEGLLHELRVGSGLGRPGGPLTILTWTSGVKHHPASPTNSYLCVEKTWGRKTPRWTFPWKTDTDASRPWHCSVPSVYLLCTGVSCIPPLIPLTSPGLWLLRERAWEDSQLRKNFFLFFILELITFYCRVWSSWHTHLKLANQVHPTTLTEESSCKLV